MATSGKRDVRLGVEIQTAGEESIRRLADDVRRLAREGGDAAPEFAALAAQIDKLGDRAGSIESLKALTEQVNRLTAEQGEAAAKARAVGDALNEQRTKANALRETQLQLAEAVRTAELELTKAKGAVSEYGKSHTTAERQTAAFTSGMAEKTAKVTASNISLVQARQELARLAPALSEAEKAETKLAGQFQALSEAARQGGQAVRQRTQALQQAEAAALAAGVSTTDLVAADQALLAALQGVAAKTNEVAEAQRKAAAVGALLADLDKQNAEVLERRLQAQLRAVEAYEREEQSLRDAAAAATRKAQADFDASEALDDLTVAQNRSRQAAESELAAIRESEQFMQRYEQSLREAADAQRLLGEAEGAAAVRKLEEAAKQAFTELRELTVSLRAAEQAAEEFATASSRAAAAGQGDVAALQARRAAAEALVEAERNLTRGQQELAAQRNAGRVALVAEAQALLTSARAADEARAKIVGIAVASRQAGDAIQQAFGAVGIRSIDAIEQEIEETSRALARLETAARRGALGADELGRATGAAEVKLARLRAEILQVQALPNVFERLSTGLNNVISRFGALGAAVGTVGIAVRPVLNATIALDQMRRTLTTVSGSSEAAAEQIAFLRRTAHEAGQSFVETGQSYAKFAASALQTGLTLEQTQQVFRSVSLAAGNLGLSSDQAKRALEALAQMASKGVVGMEELRQQLGDALPGVLPLLAKELGLTTSQLNKVVEAGNLLSSEAIPAIGRAMRTLQSEGNVTGLVANWNRFKNAILEAGTTLTDGPFGTAVGVTLRVLGKTIEGVALAAVGMSEAFRLSGLVVYESLQLMAGNTSFAEFRDSIRKATLESKEMGTEMVRRFLETKEAADGAAPSIAALGGSFAKLALQQTESIKAAELRSQTSDKMAQAAEKEAEAVEVLIGLTDNEIEQADMAAEAAAKVLKFRDLAAKASHGEAAALRAAKAAVIEKAGTDEKALAGIKAYVDKLDEKIAKADADAEKQQAVADKARNVAEAMNLAAKAAGNQSDKLDELRGGVEKAQTKLNSLTTAYKQGKVPIEAVRIATTELMQAKNLLRDALSDVSDALERELKLLRAEADVQREGLRWELERQKNRYAEAIDRGNETTARQALVRIKELEISLSRTDIDLTTKSAEAKLKELDIREKTLRSSGQMTEAKEAEIRTERKAAIAQLLGASAKDEANKQEVKSVEQLRMGITTREGHTGSVGKNTAAVGGNTGAVGSNTGAMQDNASATDKAADARERYNKLLKADPERLVGGDGGVDGFGGFETGNSKNDPFKGFTNSKIDSFGDLIRNTPDGGITRTVDGQFQPPDDSGEWEFDSVAYAAAVNGNRTGRGGPDPANFWRREAGLATSIRGQESPGVGGLLPTPPRQQPKSAPAPAPMPASSPSPSPAPAPAPAPASTSTGLVPITINLPGWGSATVSGTQSEADRLLALFEQAMRQAGASGG